MAESAPQVSLLTEAPVACVVYVIIVKGTWFWV